MEAVTEITWFGRCCFLVALNNKRILFDPYDRFCNVDIGFIDADILLSSSTWHDHGHIGSSPGAWIYTYPGIYNNFGIDITGIEARENRGTPTVVFNIRWNGFSITNFADFGADEEDWFTKNLNHNIKNVLESTNIAFIRPNILEEEVSNINTHNEIALKYCDPKIVIPEHYFPESFIDKKIPVSKREAFRKQLIIVDEMIHNFAYPLNEVDDYKVSVSLNDLSRKTLIKLLKLHPQVRWTTGKEFVRHW